MPAFITPIPLTAVCCRSLSCCSRRRSTTRKLATRRFVIRCDGQQSETPDAIRALITSEGKAEQQKGLLLIRNLPPAVALELLLLSVRTSKNDFIRASATIAIGDIDFADKERTRLDAISALVDLLATEEDYSIRAAAAAGIGYVKGADPKLVSTLLEALNRALIEDSEWQVQFSCLAALGSVCDKRAVPTLLRWLSHKNDLLVQAAIGALGDIGDESSIPDLLELLGSADMMSRQRLAHALGQMQNCSGEPAVIDALRTLCKDQSLAVREAAAESLRSFGCTAVVKENVASDEEMINIEIANLMEGNEVGNAGESARYALRRRLERSFDKEYIDSHWHKSDRLKRAASVTTGSSLRDEEAPFVSSAGEDMEEEEKLMTDMNIYNTLVDDLQNASVSAQVLAAIRLRKFDGKLGLDAVVNSNALDTKCSSQRLRAVCVNLLARGGAVDKLIEVLQNDPEQNVRSACCDALVEVGGDAAIKACIGSFETDEHWLVRISAAIALGTIGKHHDGVEHALISCMKPKGVHGLTEPQESVVRRHAITALGFIGSVKALKAFKTLLADEETETAVRSRIAAALRGIPSKESVDLLRLLIDNSNEEISEIAQGSMDALANQGFG